MAGFFERTKMAIQAGINIFRDPMSRTRNLTHQERVTEYDRRWMLYQNELYSKNVGIDWKSDLAARELYQHLRLIFNPSVQIADFHIDNIWRLVPNPKFQHLKTPLAAGTDEKIIEAVAQIDQWSNFGSSQRLLKAYAAVMGNVLIEGVDDLERQKVFHKAINPSYVTDLRLNESGDVIGYTLEYDVYDYDKRETYRFKKVVDQEVTRFYRNDKPFVPPGRNNAEEANRYGFVFAAWLRHADNGTDHGVPAFRHPDKLDEANSLGSHLHDNIHKAVESPKIIAGASEIVPIIGGTYNKETGIIDPHDSRLNWVVLKTTNGATVHDLAGSLALAEAHPYLKELLISFTEDYPELSVPAIISDSTQVSGIALERKLTPAQNRLNASQVSYNEQLVKIRQQQLAIGGMRYNIGGWNKADPARKAFAPFNLDSYNRGNLNFDLHETRLIQLTESEEIEVKAERVDYASKMKSLGLPPAEYLRAAGYDEKDIPTLAAYIEANAKAEREANKTPVPLNI
jgi:hypothetical protein